MKSSLFKGMSVVRGGFIAGLFALSLFSAEKALCANVYVMSTPVGATIFYSLNGGSWVNTGRTTNATFYGVSGGTYQVKLVKPGYKDWTSAPQSVSSTGMISFNTVLAK